MKNTEQTFEYESPRVEVIEVEVEQGFAISNYDDGVTEETGDIQDMGWDTGW